MDTQIQKAKTILQIFNYYVIIDLDIVRKGGFLLNYFYHYYIQTDVLSLVLLAITLKHSRIIGKTISATQRLFGILILAAMTTALSDMVACIVRGQVFPGARFLIHLSNMIFFESITVIAGTWCIYVFQKTGTLFSARTRMLLMIPFILISVVIVTNPLTGFVFTIDSENLYVRGSGVLLHWICSWFYFIYASGFLIFKMRKESSSLRRSEMKPMLHFVIAPGIAAIIQMAFYGISSSLSGILISIVMICLNLQESLISTDELTGINNRKQLSHFIENSIVRYNMREVLVIMMDINNFKKINDNYGHLSGDNALVITAHALRRVCEKCSLSLFLCRYGGDEFVMIGTSTPGFDPNTLRSSIQEELALGAKAEALPYPLEVSIGIVSGACESQEDFEHYLRMADEAMYDDKKRLSKEH